MKAEMVKDGRKWFHNSIAIISRLNCVCEVRRAWKQKGILSQGHLF